jgi:hypothetical protein
MLTVLSFSDTQVVSHAQILTCSDTHITGREKGTLCKQNFEYLGKVSFRKSITIVQGVSKKLVQGACDIFTLLNVRYTGQA